MKLNIKRLLQEGLIYIGKRSSVIESII